MKQFKWNNFKSERLKKSRGVSFEEIIKARLIGVKRHQSKTHQEIMLIEYKNYIWVVPFVRSNGDIFLKTLFPSRKYTKLFKERKL